MIYWITQLITVLIANELRMGNFEKLKILALLQGIVNIVAGWWIFDHLGVSNWPTTRVCHLAAVKYLHYFRKGTFIFL